MENPPGDIIRRVTKRIEKALSRNKTLEKWIIALLIGLFLLGGTLIVVAGIIRQAEIGYLGGIVEIAIAFPIHQLIKLRKENLRLEIIPEMIEYSDTINSDESKRLVFAFIVKLIERL